MFSVFSGPVVCGPGAVNVGATAFHVSLPGAVPPRSKPPSYISMPPTSTAAGVATTLSSLVASSPSVVCVDVCLVPRCLVRWDAAPVAVAVAGT